MPGGVESQWEKAQDALVLQSADFSLATLHQMVGSDQIDVAPRYQRRERWGRLKQAELIESFLLNMPVPPIYLAEEAIGRYSVIDGKQRLTAISAFMSGRLRLDGLHSFDGLDGMTVESLPIGVRTGLEVRPLRVVTVLRQSDEDLKYEVFRRLNEGAVPLDPQEIRNVLFRGPLNDLLFSLAENDYFRSQLKISPSSVRFKKMEDVEMVLRFFTLLASWHQFRGDYRFAMDEFMEFHRSPSPARLKDFKVSFETALDRCRRLWGDNAFRRPAGAGWRDQPLSGLYDAQMIGAHEISEEEIDRLTSQSGATAPSNIVRQLFKDPSFDDAVRLSTNTPNRVALRVQRMIDVLAEAARTDRTE
jgi:hypothetical protein